MARAWSNPDVRFRRRSASAGFSLIELVVVVGALSILASLMLPMLGKSVAQARLVAGLAQIQQNVAAIQAYTMQSRDIYPIAHANAHGCMSRWEECLVAAGLVPTIESTDAVGYRTVGWNRIVLSLSMLADADRMILGRTLAPNQLASSPVGVHQVTYPSQKGLMVQRCYTCPLAQWHRISSTWYFCCGTPPITAPVAMADLSLMAADRTQFIGGEDPVVIDDVGAPVSSTWGGYRARDR